MTEGQTNKRLVLVLGLLLIVGAGTATYLAYRARSSADIVPASADTWLNPVDGWIKVLQEKNPAGSVKVNAEKNDYQQVITPCLTACRSGKVAQGNEPGDLWFGTRYTKPADPTQRFNYYLVNPEKNKWGCPFSSTCYNVDENYHYAGGEFESWKPIKYSELDLFNWHQEGRNVSLPGIHAYEGENSQVVDLELFVDLSPRKAHYEAGETVTANLTLRSSSVIGQASATPGVFLTMPVGIFASAEDGADAIQVGCVPGNYGYDGHAHQGQFGARLPDHTHCLNEDHQLARYASLVKPTSATNVGYDGEAFYIPMKNLAYPDCVSAFNAQGSCPDTPALSNQGQVYFGSFIFKLPDESHSTYRLEALAEVTGHSGPDFYTADYRTSPKLWLAWYSPAFRLGQPPPELSGTITKTDQTTVPLSTNQSQTLTAGDRVTMKESFTYWGEKPTKARLTVAMPKTLKTAVADQTITRLEDGTLQREVVINPDETVTLEATLSSDCLSKDPSFCPALGSQLVLSPTVTLSNEMGKETKYAGKTATLIFKPAELAPPTLSCTYLPVADDEQETPASPASQASSTPIPCDLTQPIAWFPRDQIKVEIKFENNGATPMTGDGSLAVPDWAELLDAGGGTLTGGRLVWSNLALLPNTAVTKTVLLTWQRPASSAALPSATPTTNPCQNLTVPAGWSGTAEEWCTILKKIDETNRQTTTAPN